MKHMTKNQKAVVRGRASVDQNREDAATLAATLQDVGCRRIIFIAGELAHGRAVEATGPELAQIGVFAQLGALDAYTLAYERGQSREETIELERLCMASAPAPAMLTPPMPVATPAVAPTTMTAPIPVVAPLGSRARSWVVPIAAGIGAGIGVAILLIVWAAWLLGWAVWSLRPRSRMEYIAWWFALLALYTAMAVWLRPWEGGGR